MALDTCITNIFSEANAPSDSGSVGRPQYSGYILTEGDAAGGGSGGGGTVTGPIGGFDFHVIGPGGGSSGTVSLTITGTWTGEIAVSQGQLGWLPTEEILRIFTANVTNEIIFGNPLSSDPFIAYLAGAVSMTGGPAIVTFNAVGNRIKIMTAGVFTGGFLKLKGS